MELPGAMGMLPIDEGMDEAGAVLLADWLMLWLVDWLVDDDWEAGEPQPAANRAITGANKRSFFPPKADMYLCIGYY
jgi:hypothetical protein